MSIDHTLLGFSTQDYGAMGFIASPILTDIVDQARFDQLRAAGLRANDANHVLYAVANDCQFFVTHDTKDLLPHKLEIERICPEVKVVKPTECLAALGY